MSNKTSKNYNTAPQSVQGITTPILILSIILSFIVGLIGGYFVGESRTETRLSNLVVSAPQNNTSQDTNQNNNPTTAPTEDYSKYVINQEKNITIDNFYQDAETKGYAKNLIGSEMPKLTWKDTEGKEHSTDELGDSYIVEIFSLTCTYCQATVPEITKFREANPNIPIVSLTPDTYSEGAIDKFNADGEHAFYWEAKDAGSNLLMNNMPWVPGFLFVENGKITLVSFGGTDAGTLADYTDIAFTSK